MIVRLLALSLMFISTLAANGAPVTSLDLNGQWKFATDPKDIGTRKDTGWAELNFDDKTWKEITVPGPWEPQGYPNYNGIAWYRRSVIVPAGWRGQSVFLQLPAIDETDETFINGQRVGGMKNAFLTPRLYRIPEAVLKFGEANVIAVRVTDNYGGGGMSRGPARLMVPGPITTTTVDVAAPLDLKLCDVAGWKPGWRDEGTSDTKPRLHARPGAFDGRDAVGLECWFPNSGEYVEHRLESDLNGSRWHDAKLGYLSFYCRGVSTSGEMNVALSAGNFKWQGGGVVWSASFFVPAGEWKRVILPFSAFTKRGNTRLVEPMPDTQSITTVSIGYDNNTLRGPGEVQFARFEAGSFAATAALSPMELDGLWRVSADENDPNGEWMKWGGTWISHPPLKDATATWWRQTIDLPEPWAGLPVELSLGKLANDAATAELWLNGQKIGESMPKLPAEFHLPAGALKPRSNTVAVCIRDDKLGGRAASGPYALTPTLCQLLVRDRESRVESPANDFQHGARMGQNLDVVFALPGALAIKPGAKLSYQLVDCFHRPIKIGEAVIEGGRAAVQLPPDESRQLYQAELFSMRSVLLDAAGQPQAAFAEPSVQMKYDARDTAALPALAETIEDTPYGKLRLVDEIDAATDTDHPYKEGGIRASWVGRRAYSSWERGVTIGEHQGRKYREVNNNEWFGYRIGRGKIKPHAAYVLRVEYPENKTRYMVMNIDASRNYQGTGFKTGVSPTDPNDPYPISGNFEWYDHFVFPDDTTYGYRGSRTAPGEHGFWVFFHDNGRLYTSQYQAGPAVARIRLFEITDLAAAMPKVSLPQGERHRMLIADWEREPEAVPLDTVRYAKLMGWTAISPEVLKWGNLAYFRSTLNVRMVKPVRDPLPDGESPMYDQYLAATKELGLTIFPRLEYGGTESIPKEARAIGPDGKPAAPNRFHTWCSDLLQPATWQEMETLLDETVGQRIKDNPQIGGVQWRIRSDRMPISYSPFALELYTRETGTKADLQSVTKGGAKKAYDDWWHAKRRDFHVKLRDRLRTYRPDLKLLYYNWDPDGWSLGKSGLPDSPAEWTMFYNVRTSRQYYDRQIAELVEKKPDYLGLFLAGAKQKTYGGQPHHVLRTEYYKDVDGVALLAPLHWHFLADNDAYVNYFRTGDGLAITNMFNYEEKGRWNVQGDNYESSEMTPGGPNFAMAEEVLACFHGDPTTFTTTTYTFGRGFAAEHRRFAEAFLALPAKVGTVVSTEGDVRIRRYDTADGVYVGVVNKAYKPVKVTVRIDKAGQIVTSPATGGTVASKTDGDVVSFDVTLDPMSLQSFLIK
jgi:hypothetical protein